MIRQYTLGAYTLGCKVSQYETEALCEAFEKRGFQILPFTEKCDFYVINTCTVTAESDRKSRQIIRRALKNNENAHVLVCGCYSERQPEKIAEIKGVAAVVGTDGKMRLVDIAEDIIEKIKQGKEYEQRIEILPLSEAKFEKMSVVRAPRTRAYVKIEDGCDSKCTYCAIKEARGHIRSKPACDVISEVEGLSKNGTYEVVLTGIETGSYGKDFSEKYTLADLIFELNAKKSAAKIRLGSLAPELIGDEFIEKVRGCEILCPHFHLSVQSGSDGVLRRMKRRYNSKTALSVIEKLRAAFPDAQFTTDLMVGFPGESEEEFSETLDLVRKAKFLDAHVFAYSKREGTEAYDFSSQIDNSVKEKRSKILRDLVEKIRMEILEGIIAEKKEISALVETLDGDYYTAHSPSYLEIKFPSKEDCDLRSKTVKVRPVSQKDGVLYCEKV